MDSLDPQDVEQALTSEPDILDQLFTEPEERRIGARLLPLLAEKANRLAEASKAAELKQVVEGLQAENKKILEAKIEEFRKATTPPTADEIEKLLSQEYVEFALRLRDSKGMQAFVIRELPVAIETKIVKAIQKTLGERLREFATIEWTPGLSTLERLQKLLDVVPGAAETLTDVCALCLDPWHEQGIDGEWVRQNVSMTRVATILHAQMQVGHYRDFFSLLSRFSPATKIA